MFNWSCPQHAEREASMKVGILGSGDVAKALAGGFLKHGHQVVLGTRDAAKLKGRLSVPSATP
jgi:3-hydroxyisobutyrate dehydrogenase-like beta-hydroxyacid dehydrogenase